jgi:ABC-type molybdate transport system substrate-binding protein
MLIGTAGAAEIRVLSQANMRGIVTELQEKFQAESGHTLNVEFTEGGQVRDRIKGGEEVLLP